MLDVSAGFASIGGNNTWAVRLFAGLDIEPMLTMINPRIGIGATIIGEALDPSSSSPLPTNPSIVTSVLFGVRVIDPRPGPAGSGFALLEAGPSLIFDHATSLRPGAELGVHRVGDRVGLDPRFRAG